MKQDYQEAVKWYRKVATQGFAMAQNNLGIMYNNGHGVKQDHIKAVEQPSPVDCAGCYEHIALCPMLMSILYVYQLGPTTAMVLLQQ